MYTKLSPTEIPCSARATSLMQYLQYLSPSDCYHENGKNYRGMVRKTRKGITCQKWNVNTPHRTKYDQQFMSYLHSFREVV